MRSLIGVAGALTFFLALGFDGGFFFVGFSRDEGAYL
jgi:hypothetical protein